MPRALNALRHSPVCRRELFDAGLAAAGLDVVERLDRPEPRDVLLIWNRYTGSHERATQFEAAGATVLVVENGHLGKMWRGEQWFSLAVGHHAGAGRWPEGGGDRWDSWQVDLAAWRTAGETLIFGQRGYGEPGVRAPNRWAESARARFGGRIRQHPGTEQAKPLEEDLLGAGSALTWNSGAALKALVLGVPVFYEFEAWIGGGAALPIERCAGEPRRDDAARLAMFRRLAWAMWRADEVESGMAFEAVLA